MTSSVDDFKSVFVKRGGPAMQNRFGLFMTTPGQGLLNPDIQGGIASAITGDITPGQFLNDPRDMAILCESCQLPGRQILTADIDEGRQFIKVPNGYANEDVTFTFLLTNDYYIRKIFDTWMNKVINFETYTAGYKEDYTTDVVIQQLNKNNIPIYGIKLLNAYPINIQAIELNNTAENTVQKVTVTMTYEDFVDEGFITSALSATGSILDTFQNTFRNRITDEVSSRAGNLISNVNGFVDDAQGRFSTFLDNI